MIRTSRRLPSASTREYAGSPGRPWARSPPSRCRPLPRQRVTQSLALCLQRRERAGRRLLTSRGGCNPRAEGDSASRHAQAKREYEQQSPHGRRAGHRALESQEHGYLAEDAASPREPCDDIAAGERNSSFDRAIVTWQQGRPDPSFSPANSCKPQSPVKRWLGATVPAAASAPGVRNALATS